MNPDAKILSKSNIPVHKKKNTKKPHDQEGFIPGSL